MAIQKTIDDLRIEEADLNARLDAVRGELSRRRFEAAKGRAGNLTERQQQVLHLIRQRKSNKEIGVALNIAEQTVKFHVAGLLKKFGVQSRWELL